MSTQQNTIIEKLTPFYKGAWDEYAIKHSEGTFFHLSGWQQIIEEAYGHETYYLFARKGDQILGILPLGHIRSRLFGNALISTPFCVYGGAIADNKNIQLQLETAAEQEAINRNVDYLEIRNKKATRNDWPIKELYVTFRKNIDPDPEINLKAIPRKQRAMIRKGIKAGLMSAIHDDIDTFFNIYSTSVRNHGTPVFPKRYFSLLKSIFEEKCEVRVVYNKDKPISSVLSFYFRDEVLPYYGGGLTAARQYKAFDFMYWDLLQSSCLAGVSVFDYGRSKLGTGSYSFKKNWGFEPMPLPYQYRLVKADYIPDVNPLNPKYQVFIKFWQKLPLSLANTFGPYLSKNLG